MSKCNYCQRVILNERESITGYNLNFCNPLHRYLYFKIKQSEPPKQEDYKDKSLSDKADLYLSFDGRISRSTYWLMYIVPIFIILIAGGIVDYMLEARNIIYMITILAIIWPGLAGQAKRWHDRDKSALWILIGFIPLIGPIWSTLEIGFFKGTNGDNRFGPDPLE